MSYFRYLSSLAHSGIQHILCCVFVLFFFVLCTLCCQFLWIVHLWLPLRYALMFIKLALYATWKYNTYAASDLTSVFAFTMYKFYFSITYYYEQKVYKVMVKLPTNN